MDYKKEYTLKKSFKKNLKKNLILYRVACITKEFHHKYFLDEMAYTRNKFKKEIGRELDLDNPIAYNDKLHWLKFNWRNNLATLCSDKYLARGYVRDKGFGDILNDVYGIYDSVHEINIEDFPEKFVLKANHGSGWNSICTDKNSYDWKKEKYRLCTWMKLNYYYKNMEWVYKNITPKILCEKFLEEDDTILPTDYKIFCFNGEPKFTYVCVDRDTNVKYDYYDLEWVKHPIAKGAQNSNKILPKPFNYEYMLEISKTLSEPFPHARIDLYEVSGKVVFGEITMYPSDGLDKFDPEEQDFIIGEMLELPAIIQ
jgi:hypothetical protein